MQDKLKTAREESGQVEVKDLHDKMRRLKKHQAFEAEVMANTDRIKDIKQVGHAQRDTRPSRLRSWPTLTTSRTSSRWVTLSWLNPTHYSLAWALYSSDCFEARYILCSTMYGIVLQSASVLSL